MSTRTGPVRASEALHRRSLWGAQLITPRGPAGLVTALWDVGSTGNTGPRGSAMTYRLFVNREYCRAWCREVNADLERGQRLDGAPSLRVKPVRVTETLGLE